MMSQYWNTSFSLWGLAPATMLILGAMAIVLIFVSIFLKGIALWNAAKRDELVWFVLLLVVNTLGVLELIYLVFVVKKWNKYPHSKK